MREFQDEMEEQPREGSSVVNVLRGGDSIAMYLAYV